MPSLSLDYTLVFNHRTGHIELTDTSVYPAGVAAGISGYLTVTQPDGITRDYDNPSPDISWNGTALNVGTVELRLDSKGNPQKGTYVITYTVKHNSYSNSSLTRTFICNYERPEIVISESFDVFTPLLSLSDGTDYDLPNFADPTLTRAWSVAVGTVGTRTGTGSSLDLAISGDYYDALYTGTLTVNVSYTHQTYTYLTILDTLEGDIDTSANTPPTFTNLKAYLKIIKARFDALVSVRQTISNRQEYEYASDLLWHIKQRICDNDTVNLYPQIQDFLNVYYDRISAVYTNTNTVIAPYDYTDVDCGTGGGGTLLPPNCFIVGVTAGAPTAGSNTWTNENISTSTRLIRNRIPMATIEWLGESYYTVSGTTLTLFNDTFQDNDLLQI